MARAHAASSKGSFQIPAAAFTFEGFRRWAQSDTFPENGRIDYLAGDVDADMSPEEISTHSLVKSAFALGLGILIAERKLGYLFIDRFDIHTLKGGVYTRVRPSVGGWLRSPRLGVSFRLVRHIDSFLGWNYTLELRG